MSFSFGAGGSSSKFRRCARSLSVNTIRSFCLITFRASATTVLVTNSVKSVCCIAAARTRRDFSSEAMRNESRELLSTGICGTVTSVLYVLKLYDKLQNSSTCAKIVLPSFREQVQGPCAVTGRIRKAHETHDHSSLQPR